MDIKTELLLIDISNHLEKTGSHCLNVLQAAYLMRNPDELPEDVPETLIQAILHARRGE